LQPHDGRLLHHLLVRHALRQLRVAHGTKRSSDSAQACAVRIGPAASCRALRARAAASARATAVPTAASRCTHTSRTPISPRGWSVLCCAARCGRTSRHRRLRLTRKSENVPPSRHSRPRALSDPPPAPPPPPPTPPPPA